MRQEDFDTKDGYCAINIKGGVKVVATLRFPLFYNTILRKADHFDQRIGVIMHSFRRLSQFDSGLVLEETGLNRVIPANPYRSSVARHS